MTRHTQPDLSRVLSTGTRNCAEMCWICREITLHSHTFTQTTRSYAERVTCISSCTASSHLGRVMSPHTNDSARALCGRTRQEIESPVCPDPTYPHPGMSVRHHHTPPDRTPNPVNIAPPTKAVGVYVPAIPVPIRRLSSCMHGAHAGHTLCP